MKIVITDYCSVPAEAKSRIKSIGGEVYDDLPKTDEEIVSRCINAELITACYIDITSKIIDQLPSLRYIIVPAVGYEWVDVKYARDRGIIVSNCPTHNSITVAEYLLY